MVKPGKYKHYRNKLYRVVGTAFDRDTLEEFIIYAQLYETAKHKKGTLWIRPKREFESFVNINGKKIKRFKFLEA